MTQQILLILGGVGLFIFGMGVMTDALREAAGGRLRRFLTTFTTTPLRGVMTGTVTTALIQSSSATTVMTVGFVGAGLLSFPHALGVLFGANIGTTFTGWMVTWLGFKLHLGTLALPGLFVASLLGLLARGNLARFGRVLAGLCLLFIGLDLMQEGAAAFSEILQPEDLPSQSLLGQLQLLTIGLVMTVVMQSSSAALAVALVFLSTGSISFAQAAAMVIGMNLGTTVTAMMASVGGTVTMRQTAVANLLFNIGTAILAFPLLWFSAAPFEAIARSAGDETALVVFHTAFNIVGTLIFLPFTRQFAGFVQRLLPDEGAGLTDMLDPKLLTDEGAAMDAAHVCFSGICSVVFAALGRAFSTESDLRALSTLKAQAGPALDELQDYLRQIHLPDDKPREHKRYAAMLHQIDHTRRMLSRLRTQSLIPVLLNDPGLRRPALYFGTLLRRTADDGHPGALSERLIWLSELIEHRSKRHRRATLLREHAGLIALPEMFDRTDAMRWLRRMAGHAATVAEYDRDASLSQSLVPDKDVPTETQARVEAV